MTIVFSPLKEKNHTWIWTWVILSSLRTKKKNQSLSNGMTMPAVSWWLCMHLVTKFSCKISCLAGPGSLKCNFGPSVLTLAQWPRQWLNPSRLSSPPYMGKGHYRNLWSTSLVFKSDRQARILTAVPWLCTKSILFYPKLLMLLLANLQDYLPYMTNVLKKPTTLTSENVNWLKILTFPFWWC